jgi:hypothetical protein
MNPNYLINMLIRRFSRMAMNKGIDASIDYASRRGRPDGEMTPEERKVARQAKQSARRARQAAKLTRRMGRF